MSMAAGSYERPQLPQLHPVHPPQVLSLTLSPTTIAYGVLTLLLVYHVLQHFDHPLLPVSELLWNVFVYLTPLRLISAFDASSEHKTHQKKDGQETLASEKHAAKSEAMRRILGLNGAGVSTAVQQTRSFSGLGNIFQSRPSGSPPGLGNWDNSCYQNSIIQGLAALPSISTFLERITRAEESQSTKEALKEILSKLNDPLNIGKLLWIPPGLKSMSSWQQQDAQEYFSKVIDEVERETLRTVESKSTQAGLALVAETELHTTKVTPDVTKENSQAHDSPASSKTRGLDQLPDELGSMIARSPLEGLLAQRVGCLTCGYVEGLSLIPFNCLTVPLGKQWMYDVRTCLNDYTNLEPINGVECAKCTLLHNKKQIERLRSQFYNKDTGGPDPLTPPSSAGLLGSIESRLAAVNGALDQEDFSDNTITKKCQIPARSRISTTKSRQAVIARAPNSLAIHVNRSVFNEFSGVQSKNLADVRFPLHFNLASWCLGNMVAKNGSSAEVESWNLDPSVSMLPMEADTENVIGKEIYELRAVITHYGRHENGHYICYRRHPSASKSEDGVADPWWRFSDDEVAQVSEENVLSQSGVFMLFYEKSMSQERKAGGKGVPKQGSSIAVSSDTKQEEFYSPPEKTAIDTARSQEPIQVDDSASTATQPETPRDAPEIAKTNMSPEERIECPTTSSTVAFSEIPAEPSMFKPSHPPTSPSSKIQLPSVSGTSFTSGAPPAVPHLPNATGPPQSPPPPTNTISSPTLTVAPQFSPSLSSPSPSPPTDPPQAQDNASLPRKLTPPPMRTAGPRSGGRGVNRKGKRIGMGMEGGMVEAN